MDDIDPLIQRDQIIAEATALFDSGKSDQAITVLAQLECATVDAATLAATDEFLPLIASGRRVIATCDNSRSPSPDEVVIIYGNYPHAFKNIAINNPMRRHVALFFNAHHDEVEFDHRWNSVEQIYIINVEQRIDRYDAVLRELARARAPLNRITRIPACGGPSDAPPGTKGAIGCLKSHVEALRRGKAQVHSNFLVLEDDFCFSDDLEKHLNDLQVFFDRGYDYTVCLLATSKYGRIVNVDDLVVRSMQPCTNTAAYLVAGSRCDELLEIQEYALERLIATHDGEQYAADRYWTTLQRSGRFLVFREKFGFQVASFSNIENNIARYLD